VFRIGGNTFYNQKNKIPMKIPEFKRSAWNYEQISQQRPVLPERGSHPHPQQQQALPHSPLVPDLVDPVKQ
jgi:hypothetical protein